MMEKRAVSEMVSYVILIVIAVGLSVGIYGFLSVYTPKDHPTCSDDVKIIIQSYTCDIDTTNEISVNLTLLNKGLFSIDAAYIRFGESVRKVKDLVNEDDLYFVDYSNPGGLAPGETAVKNFTIPNGAVSTSYGVEVEPAVFSEGNELALCSKAVIVQDLNCAAV